MTSNIGSDLIKRDSGLGFAVKTDEAQTDTQQYERMKDKVMDEVKRFFRPEFINRSDALFSGRVRAVCVPPERSIDIDTELDFRIVECLFSHRLNDKVVSDAE